MAGAREAARKVASCIDLRSPSLRHALRWGIGLGVGVAAYQVIDLGPHGYWIPLTVLFVLKATPGDTYERIAMRAVGTFAGLVLATAIAELIGRDPVVNATILTIAAACSFALLAIEYALFTTAITVYIVVLSHALGQAAFQAVDERGIATVIGLVIAALGFVVLRDRPSPEPFDRNDGLDRRWRPAWLRGPAVRRGGVAVGRGGDGGAVVTVVRARLRPRPTARERQPQDRPLHHPHCLPNGPELYGSP